MRTKVIEAGGSYFDDKAVVIWEGDLPMTPPGILFLHTDADDKDVMYMISNTAIQAKGEDLWQVVYVKNTDPKASGRMLVE